jgi:hypothetical protein
VEKKIKLFLELNFIFNKNERGIKPKNNKCKNRRIITANQVWALEMLGDDRTD